MIAEDLARFFDDPYGYVMWVFPWGKANTPLEHETGPRKWQEEFLKEWSQEIKLRGFDWHVPVPPIQISSSQIVPRP